jgi:addiction module HigA family antidote
MLKIFEPIHPGEILLEEFLKPLEISQSSIARDINVPLRTINEICNGKRSITPLTALRLAEYFRMSAEFWTNSQTNYELELVRDKDLERIKKETRPIQRKIGDLSFKFI